MDASNIGNDYAVMDNNGFMIEKSKNFNTSISGYAFDIVQKARKILNNDTTYNNVEIIFENQTILLKDDCSSKLNMCMIVSEEKNWLIKTSLTNKAFLTLVQIKNKINK